MLATARLKFRKEGSTMRNPKKVIIFDTTLRDGEQSPGCSMNVLEKVELSRQLARLKVDIIEAGFPITSQGDFEAVQRISEEVDGPIICALARTMEKDIIRAGQALKPTHNGRIHTFIGTSKIHVEKKLRMTPEEVIKNTVNAIQLAKTFTDDVEFSCEDAGRTDLGYIVEVLAAAIEAGATTLNIPDTVGYCVPNQFGECIAYVKAKTPGIEKCIISVHCHNDLGMAVANALSGILNGARQVECTINGIGERAGNASLEEIVMNLLIRKDYYGVETNINTQEIYRTSRMLSRITGVKVQPNKAIVGDNAFSHEAGIHQAGVLRDRETYEIIIPEDVGWVGESMVMGKHSGRNSLAVKLKSLGFNLSEEDIDKTYKIFKDLCDRKKEIFEEDILTIVEHGVLQAEPKYKLLDLQVVASMNKLPRVAVELGHNKESCMASASGNGQVDAVYRALEIATGLTVKLVDYSIDGVTGGNDAQGRVSVRLKIKDNDFRGIGVATDIIIASALAWINAVNRYFLNSENFSV